MNKKILSTLLLMFATINLQNGSSFTGDVRVNKKTIKVIVDAVVEGTTEVIQVPLTFDREEVKSITFEAIEVDSES